MTNYRLTPLRDTSENKKRIIEQTRNKMQTQTPYLRKKSSIGMPIVIAALSLFLALFLGSTYLQQAFFNKQDLTIEKIVIPNVEYSSLINSTYIEETNEIIYTTEKGFYSFNVEDNETTLLVDTSQIGEITAYDVSPKWLIWAQTVGNEDKIHVFNRQTNEIRVADVNYFSNVALQDDTFIYMGYHLGEGYMSTLNLNDFTYKPLHQILGESSSRSKIEGNKIAIVEEKNEMETNITVYDFVKHEQLGHYTFPYKNIQSITLKGDKIFGYTWDNEENTPFIGAIDMNTNKFNKIKSDISVDGYATDGEHFAVAVKKGERNSVQLFNVNDGELKQLSKLSSIKERLVKPRFTEQGTLVVNGEGKDHAMYLIRFNE